MRDAYAEGVKQTALANARKVENVIAAMLDRREIEPLILTLGAVPTASAYQRVLYFPLDLGL